MPAVAGMTYREVELSLPFTRPKSVVLAKARIFVDGERYPPPRA